MTTPVDVDTTGRVGDVKTTWLNALINHGTNVPQPMQGDMATIIANQGPVDSMVKLMECGYAALKTGIADATTESAFAQAVGQASNQVLKYNFHGKSSEAQQYLAIARRFLGATTTPDPTTDPTLPAPYNKPPVPTPSAVASIPTTAPTV